MKESTINKRIQDWLISEGAYVIKTVVCTRAGVPDILVCYNGRFIAIEGKTPKGIVSVLQQAHITKIRQSGGLAIVARSLLDAKDQLIPWMREVDKIEDYLQNQTKIGLTESTQGP